MPVHHPHTIKAGTTSKLLFLYAEDADGCGAGKTGLAHDTPGAIASYVREGESAAVVVHLRPGRVGQWVAGGLVEVNPELMPGVYQLGAPDALLAEGAAWALLLLRFPGTVIRPLEIHLVAYDPQDAERIGLWSLASSKRHEFLRQALPRLTEKELALGEQAEQQLRARRAAERG
jgi:hypothetical protein